MKFNKLVYIGFFVILIYSGYVAYLSLEEGLYLTNLGEQKIYFTKLAQDKGVDFAFEEAKRRYYDGDKKILPICHDIAHFIGWVASDLYRDIDGAFQHGDAFCWSGYHHGVIEKSVLKLDDLKKGANSICENFPGKENRSFDYYSCLHGLGHAAMSLANYELFDSLEVCGLLEDEWERQSCYSGVFMENTFTVIRYNNMKYLNPKEPHFPCNQVENKYKSSCYFVQSSYMLEVVNYDYSKVFKLCGESEKPYDGVCYRSLGRDVVDEVQSNIKKIKKLCLLGRDFNQESNCVVGAAQSLNNQFKDGKNVEDFCNSLPENLAEVCFGAVSVN